MQLGQRSTKSKPGGQQGHDATHNTKVKVTDLVGWLDLVRLGHNGRHDVGCLGNLVDVFDLL